MFEIYSKDVTINGTPYRIRPLPGEYLGKLLEVIKKFPSPPEGSDSISSKDFLEAIDAATVTDIYDLCLKTFESSYPDRKEDFAPFVSQNMFTIFPVLVEVNMHQA